MKYFDQKLNRRILKELEKERDMNINYQPILVDQDNSDSPLSISSSSEYSEIELNIKKNLSRRSVTNFNENELMCRSSLSEEIEHEQCKEFTILVNMTETRREIETKSKTNNQNQEEVKQQNIISEIYCNEDPSCLCIESLGEDQENNDRVSEVNSVISHHSMNQNADAHTNRENEISEIKTQTYFSGPDQRNHRDLEQKLQKLLYTAKNKVWICNYIIGNGIMSVDVANKLKKKCGVNFKIITDQMQVTNKNLKKYCNELLARGVTIKKNNNAKNLMHCKFMIIDDKYIVEGSMNLGEKSLKNYEHITISTDKHTIQAFNARFESMWNNQERFSNYTNDDSDESSCNNNIPISID